MPAFQDNRQQTEQKVMMRLLSAVEKNSSFTQRNLASELGIALGLMNQYLRRCVTKGWIRVTQVSPRRIRYFITPEGFSEKSRMVKSYLSRSLSFFREARAQCEEMFSLCQENAWQNIGLIGEGDLVDIVQLVSHGTGIHVLPTTMADIKDFDAIMITDVMNPQGIFDELRKKMSLEKILTLELLHVSRKPLKASSSEQS